MDPNETLRQALAETGQGAYAKAYNAWIQRKGFPARVKIDPATDLFMRGITHAEVRWVGRKFVTLAETTVRGFYTGKLVKSRVTVLETP